MIQLPPYTELNRFSEILVLIFFVGLFDFSNLRIESLVLLRFSTEIGWRRAKYDSNVKKYSRMFISYFFQFFRAAAGTDQDPILEIPFFGVGERKQKPLCFYFVTSFSISQKVC